METQMKLIPLLEYGGTPRDITEFANAAEAMAYADAIHAEHIQAHEKNTEILEHNKAVVDHFNNVLIEAGFTTLVAAPRECVRVDPWPILLSGYKSWKADCENWDVTMKMRRETSEWLQRMAAAS